MSDDNWDWGQFLIGLGCGFMVTAFTILLTAYIMSYWRPYGVS